MGHLPSPWSWYWLAFHYSILAFLQYFNRDSVFFCFLINGICTFFERTNIWQLSALLCKLQNIFIDGPHTFDFSNHKSWHMEFYTINGGQLMRIYQLPHLKFLFYKALESCMKSKPLNILISEGGKTLPCLCLLAIQALNQFAWRTNLGAKVFHGSDMEQNPFWKVKTYW